MVDEPTKFTHIGVKEDTQKMIAILAQVANGGQRMKIYEFVDILAKNAWEEAKQVGVVTDAMLNPPVHWVAPAPATKKRRQRVVRDI